MTADNPVGGPSRAGGFSPGVFGSGERFDAGASVGPGSREPSPAVSALPGFDPSRDMRFSHRAEVMRAIEAPERVIDRVSTEHALEHRAHWQARAVVKAMWDLGWRPEPYAWLDLEPQQPGFEHVGPEPSLRAIVRAYYLRHFYITEAERHTAQYFRSLASAMSAGTAETPMAAQGDSPPARPEGDAHIPQGNQ